VAQIIYTDDADAFLSWTVTDTEGQDLDWADPMIAVGDAAYAAATWQGAADSTREIRLPAPLALGLDRGVYTAYLKVPNGNDFSLGRITVAER
jgi:hypothetical protein